MGNTTDDGYNGWKNHETWTVNVWIGSDEGTQGYWEDMAASCWDATDAECESTEDRAEAAVRALESLLKEGHTDAFEILDIPRASMWTDLLTSALEAVDWREIAEAMVAGVDQD
jgi:hypothetical protein